MARILLLTDVPDLIEEVLRLAAAAGLEVDVATDVGAASRLWRKAPLALVGQDALDRAIEAGLPRRSGVVLLAADVEDETMWRRAVSLGVEHVAYLPDGESWFVDRLLAVSPNGARAGIAVGVIGGRGGAGATTLATALAVTTHPKAYTLRVWGAYRRTGETWMLWPARYCHPGSTGDSGGAARGSSRQARACRLLCRERPQGARGSRLPVGRLGWRAGLEARGAGAQDSPRRPARRTAGGGAPARGA